jgi:hypothetical protein
MAPLRIKEEVNEWDKIKNMRMKIFITFSLLLVHILLCAAFIDFLLEPLQQLSAWRKSEKKVFFLHYFLISKIFLINGFERVLKMEIIIAVVSFSLIK